MLKRIIIALMLFFSAFTAKTYAVTYSYCVGTDTTKPPCADSFLIAFPGGTWSSSNPAIGTVDPSTGRITLIAPGNITITYTVGNSCGTFSFSYDITVNPLPTAITGPDIVCVGKTITLSSTPGGGTWYSSNSGVATVGASSGIVTGISPGTSLISYSLSTGCNVTKIITVNPNPTISDGRLICGGSTDTLFGTPSGGTWSSSNASVATVTDGGSGRGIVIGIGSGTAIITYTVGSCFDTTLVTVSAPDISGDSAVCVGSTTTLSGTPSGGTWSSSDVTKATVGSASGVVTGIAAGTTTITYKLSNGCFKTRVITIGGPFSIKVCEIAPIITCDTAISYCNSLTVRVSGLPVGNDINWNPGIPAVKSNGTGTDVIYTFTASPTATKTYTVTGTYAGCKAQDIVTIVVASGNCTPCDMFKPSCSTCTDSTITFATIYASSLTSSNIRTDSAKNYFIADRLGSGGTVDILKVSPAPGSVFAIDNDMQLQIVNTDSVVLDSCHFFSPCNTWRGIWVNVDGSTAAKIKLVNNTLIENCYTHGTIAGAVGVHDVGHSGVTIPAYGNIIESNGAIFNQDATGISIYKFTSQNLPFTIKKTIFTNRNFCKFYTGDGTSCKSHYPFTWPTTDSLKTQYDTGLNPVFNLDKYPALHSTKDTAGGYGIYLNEVGKTLTTAIPNTYYSLVLGDSSNAYNTNIFDTITQGVAMVGANVIFYNNIFRDVTDASSINTQVAIGGNTQTLYSVEILENEGSHLGTNNRFYNCYTNVGVSSCHNFTCKGALFSANSVSYALKGIEISGSAARIENYLIRENRFKNISGSILIGNTTNTVNNGEIVVRENYFDALVSDSLSTGGTAIDVGDVNTSSSAVAVLHIDSNTIQGQTIGINVHVDAQGTKAGTLSGSINNNAIKINNIINGNLVGIACRDRQMTEIKNNLIYGDTANAVNYNYPAVTFTGGAPSGSWGIEIIATGNTTDATTVSCNYIRDLGLGFVFEKTNKLNLTNNMMMRNSYGIYFYLAAQIGQQGSKCDPSDNVWADDSTVNWPGWTGGGIYQTYTGTGVNPSPNSIIYVRQNPATTWVVAPYKYYYYNPTKNGTNGGTAYASGISIFDSTAYCGSVPNPDTPCVPGSFRPEGEGDGLSGEMYSRPSTKIQELNSNQFSVFPNPSDGNIVIREAIPGNDKITVRVLNYLGAEVYGNSIQLKNGMGSVQTQIATPGMYLLQIQDEQGKVSTFKLVIQK